tara:strand:- start:400 stop:558 length:159 start_codon:yes stop_codon:yes gene_type:complete
MKNIKKEMMEVNGGDFIKWYKSLTNEEKKEFRKQFEKLQESENISPRSTTSR